MNETMNMFCRRMFAIRNIPLGLALFILGGNVLSFLCTLFASSSAALNLSWPAASAPLYGEQCLFLTYFIRLMFKWFSLVCVVIIAAGVLGLLVQISHCLSRTKAHVFLGICTCFIGYYCYLLIHDYPFLQTRHEYSEELIIVHYRYAWYGIVLLTILAWFPLRPLKCRELFGWRLLNPFQALQKILRPILPKECGSKRDWWHGRSVILAFLTHICSLVVSLCAARQYGQMLLQKESYAPFECVSDKLAGTGYYASEWLVLPPDRVFVWLLVLSSALITWYILLCLALARWREPGFSKSLARHLKIMLCLFLICQLAAYAFGSFAETRLRKWEKSLVMKQRRSLSVASLEQSYFQGEEPDASFWMGIKDLYNEFPGQDKQENHVMFLESLEAILCSSIPPYPLNFAIRPCRAISRPDLYLLENFFQLEQKCVNELVNCGETDLAAQKCQLMYHVCLEYCRGGMWFGWMTWLQFTLMTLESHEALLPDNADCPVFDKELNESFISLECMFRKSKHYFYDDTVLEYLDYARCMAEDGGVRRRRFLAPVTWWDRGRLEAGFAQRFNAASDFYELEGIETSLSIWTLCPTTRPLNVFPLLGQLSARQIYLVEAAFTRLKRHMSVFNVKPGSP